MARAVSPSFPIDARRLRNQQLVGSRCRRPADVVAWFGAVQAQDYRAAKWALGLRTTGETIDADIERAIDRGLILRTHVLRPTWHFVAAADIRWMLELTAPRIHKALTWGHGKLGLDMRLRGRAATMIERALTREACLTRAELMEHLGRAGIRVKGVHLALLVMHAEIEGLICSGPRRGTQSTYALLDRRVPARPRLSRDEALGELTRRYLQSHGPATLRDFAWWSGLAAADAKRGAEIVRARRAPIDGLVYWSVTRHATRASASPGAHLLPIYDEYLVAYRDLEAVPRGKAFWGILPQVVVVGGQVAGTWKATRGRDGVAVVLKAARAWTRGERHHVDAAVDRYRRFHSSTR